MIWSTAIGMAVLMGVGWGTAAYSNLLLARSLAIIGWLTFLISAATGVLYLVWLYRAVANLRYLGADSSDFLPGATIFCHFFPLLNLIVPFQVLLDLSKASQSPKHWREQKKSRVVIVWWIATAAFFFNGLFIVSVAMVGLPAHSAMLVTISAWATLASFVIPPLCLMHVVKKVTQQQETLHAVYS
ncbi:MAG: DUF4328 domain-containing protein [Verrucomicrobiota bacterium JB022]|nr:DUF4328 domain-containing protein [Verrucomicrobiota bacterium JB022]